MINNELISRTIKNIRFPMIMGVVLIHCTLSSDNCACNSIQHLFSDLLPAACVPIFFLMSGFLFFWQIEEWNKESFLIKFKKRFHSLVVPYLIWNTFTIALFACMHLFLPSLINPNFENVPDWGLLHYLSAYWDGSGGFPINYPLWFLRNLIVMVYLTPLFYLLVYRMGIVRWLGLAAFVVWYFTSESGTSMGAFYFYSGVLFAYLINKNTDLGGQILKRIAYASGVVFASMIVLSMMNMQLTPCDNNILRLSGTVALLGVFIDITKKGLELPKWLGESCFFIYLYHALPLLVLSRVLVKVLHPVSSFSWIVVYFTNYLLIIVIGVVLYYILNRVFPHLTAVICGGR